MTDSRSWRDMPAIRDGNTWKMFMGLAEEDRDLYRDAIDFARAPADEAWVFACMEKRSKAAMSVPLRVYVTEGRDRMTAEESGDEDALELLDLLTVVNPTGEWNGTRLRGYLAAGSAVWGGSYVAKVRGRLGGRPRELWWLDLAHVKVESASGRQADRYVYDPPKGGMSEYRPSDIIAFRNVNLLDPLNPLSPLSAARNDVATNRYAAIHTASTLRNDGIPKGAFVPQKGAIIEPQQKRSLINVLRGLRGPKNAGKTPFINADVQWMPLALNPKDAEWIAARKVSRMTVCAAMGVPLPLVGDWEGLSQYSVLRDAERFMWHHTLIPDLDWIAAVLNDQLVPEFDPTRRRISVGIDYNGVEALGPEWKEKWDAHLAAVTAQTIVPDEFRAVFGFEGKLPWGDQATPKTTVAVKPQDVTVSTPVVDPGETASTPEPTPEEEADAAESLRAIGRLYARAQVKAFIAGAALDASFLGARLGDADRAILEDGIRRRQSAVQIAERIEATRTGDVTAAVVGQLRSQWPDTELDIVRGVTWSYDPEMRLDKIDYARRPVARNEQKVDDFTAALKVGAPMRPAVVVKTDAGWVPIDGWHHLLAADHAGLDRVPVYRGKGDPDAISALLAFNDTIPTPKREKE